MIREFGDFYARNANALEHRSIERGVERYPDIAPSVSWYWAKREEVVTLSKADRRGYFGAGRVGRMTEEIFDVIDRRLSIEVLE